MKVYLIIQAAILAAILIYQPEVFVTMLVGAAVVYGGFYLLCRAMGFWKPKTPKA